ncbi:ferredoxin domain-containing protein [Methanoculleus frigidifontis]
MMSSTETDAVLTVAGLMALSARTAPKGKGVDAIAVRTVAGDDLAALSGAMREFGETNNQAFFIRDAKNVADSDACLLIGSAIESVAGIDCGGCGFPTCAAMLEAQAETRSRSTPLHGHNCIIRMADLGIAVGSAAKTAAMHNVDNRIMYTAGVGALRLGWMEGCGVVYGIPLSASGKNIFFDRTR